MKRKPPEKFVAWSNDTFVQLQAAPPEPLVSRFEVSHGMLLQVLSRKSDGCRAMQKIATRQPRDRRAKNPTANAPGNYSAHYMSALLKFCPNERTPGGKLRLNIDLQVDFSSITPITLFNGHAGAIG